MYAGRIFEYTDVKTIFKNPLNPYTKGLLDSLPQRNRERLTPIHGMIPSIMDMPEGCKFNTRCRYVFDKCLAAEPDLIDVQDNGAAHHLVRCWLYQK
jgi:peptide/nickel transport system ATP-binding protein